LSIYAATPPKRQSTSTVCLCFFFQAEDGIRDRNVTGVQTCALPIFRHDDGDVVGADVLDSPRDAPSVPVVVGAASTDEGEAGPEIGRASCREREEKSGGAGCREKKRRGDRTEETGE